MNLLSKWTLGGGLAVAAIVAAFSLFGGSAQAGLDDPGELIGGPRVRKGSAPGW
jgi:hypothetical protein